jgi:hypothetical protein
VVSDQFRVSFVISQHSQIFELSKGGLSDVVSSARGHSERRSNRRLLIQNASNAYKVYREKTLIQSGTDRQSQSRTLSGPIER